MLVKPLSDSFQAKVKLERFGYPSQFADISSISRGSTVSAHVKTIRSLPSVLIVFIFVHCERRCHLFDIKLILKQ